MDFYEIRTLTSRQRTSLVMIAEFESDISAILLAQDILRKGEGVEVWRKEKLIYRLGARTNINLLFAPHGNVSSLVSRIKRLGKPGP